MVQTGGDQLYGLHLQAGKDYLGMGYRKLTGLSLTTALILAAIVLSCPPPRRHPLL
jgi:hypothetical protein